MQLLNSSRKLPGYVVASFLCSFGGFLFGIDTGIIGPVTVMKEFTNYVGNPSPTIHGLIVSAILIPAAISSFFAGRLADAVGRRRAISIGAFIFGGGAALEAASVHIAMFVAGRVIEGIGEGLYLGTLVVYVHTLHRCVSRISYVQLTLSTQLHLRDLSPKTPWRFDHRTSIAHNSWLGRWLFHMLWHREHGVVFFMAPTVYPSGGILCSIFCCHAPVAPCLSTMAYSSRKSQRGFRGLGAAWRPFC